LVPWKETVAVTEPNRGLVDGCGRRFRRLRWLLGNFALFLSAAHEPEQARGLKNAKILSFVI